MSEKIREIYIVFKPTECWRQLAPVYETWYAWTQADNEWQVMPSDIERDENLDLDYKSDVIFPQILIGGIDDWLEWLFSYSKSMNEPSPENRLSFFCDQLLKAGVASEIVEKNVWTFKE